MEDLVLVFIVLSVSLFVLRYVIKHVGIDFLTAMLSLSSLTMVLQDPTIPQKYHIACVLILGLICLLSFFSLAVGNRREDSRF